MDAEELRAVIDGLVVVHRSGVSGTELHLLLHEVVLQVRPFHEDAFEFATHLGSDADPAVRAACADLLGEVCNGDPVFVGRVLPTLTEMAAGETDPTVISSIVGALGKTWDQRAVPLLVGWASHADDNVRFEVASALHGTMSNESDPDAVAALIGLTRDPVPLVRDWATFVLGNSAASGPEVEHALLDRLADEDPHTRAEAFMALAERGDQRIVEPLATLLSGGSIGTLEVRAAGKLADVCFHPPLVTMAEWWGDNDLEVIESAIRRCDPALRPLAEQTEATIVDELRTRLPGRGNDQITITAEGTYPLTVIALTLGGSTEHGELWSYEDDDPMSLDYDLAVQRLCNLASSMVRHPAEEPNDAF